MTPSAQSEEFLIRWHPPERVLEVTYPTAPTPAAIERYGRALRARVGSLEGTWSCIADQRSMAVMGPESSEAIATLNAWAVEHGMRRSVRVVRESAIAQLQAQRILRGAMGGDSTGRIAHALDEAWRWLREGDADD